MKLLSHRQIQETNMMNLFFYCHVHNPERSATCALLMETGTFSYEDVTLVFKVLTFLRDGR